MYAGDPDEGERLTRPLRELATPLADMSATMPYLDKQGLLDVYFPAGLRYYWKALYLDGLADEAIDAVVSWCERRPSPRSFAIIRNVGAAVSRVGTEETAFGDRSSEWMLSIDSTWEDAADDERNIAWTRAFFADAERFSQGKAYFNFPGLHEEGDALVRSSYGANHDRLAQIKAAYDPENRFRLNQNIRPAA
jgi:FAD/FMN-containing dehydrogenase